MIVYVVSRPNCEDGPIDYIHGVYSTLDVLEEHFGEVEWDAPLAPQEGAYGIFTVHGDVFYVDVVRVE